MSVANLTTTRNLTQNISRIEKLKSWNKNRLESTGEIEHLFISIYRIDFETLDRRQLMQDIIFHLNDSNKVKSKVQLKHRFSTIYNNRILGLEVQNASVYGSKIQLAFDDFDKELSKSIKKNDVIVIHRINNKKLRKLDALASIVGLSTYTPSGIKEGRVASGISTAFKALLLTGRVENKIIREADEFLNKEPPIFSGLITNPNLVMGSSIKLTIEAQDMVRILQHINTEEHRQAEFKGIPVNLDNYLIKVVIDDENELDIKGNDHIKILKSYILTTLSLAVMEHIKGFDNARRMNDDGIHFIDENLSETGEQIEDVGGFDFNNSIFIKPISNGMHLIHISPIKAIKLFTKFYAKNTGINVFFDINTWDTNFLGDKDVIETIYKNIYKDKIGHNPYFTFGIILDIKNEPNIENIVTYGENKVVGTTDQIKFDLFKRFALKHTFTEQSFDVIRRHRVNESVVLKFINSSDQKGYEETLSEFFFHFVRPKEIDINAKTGILPDRKGDLFKTDGKSFIISRNARQLYQDKLNEIRIEFDKTISLDYIVHTNFTSVRSVEYNSLLTNQMKSIPITQVIQLFLGAMTVIPVSQSKETTGFDNTSYNISQRIWLSSAIGFSNKDTGVERWIWKEGSDLKPTIYFGLNYRPAYVENDNENELDDVDDSDDRVNTKATYISDKDLINAQMYTLPDNGNLSIYNWSTDPEIHIGYSKYNEGDHKDGNTKTPLSLGMTNVFDLMHVAGDFSHYVSENIEQQVGGGNTPITFPRICAFTLLRKVDPTKNTHASTALARYDQFNEVPKGVSTFENPGVGTTPYSIYLGYDMYGMKNEPTDGFKLQGNSDLIVYAPIFDGTTAKLAELGNIVNPTRSNVKAIWKDTIGDFPDDNKAKIADGTDRRIITGIQKYLDPTKLLPMLRSYSHFIDLGFTGVNGEGDKSWYDNADIFQIFHNINIDPNNPYLDTFKLDDNEGRAEITTVQILIDSLIVWVKQFEGNEVNKRKMMVKYAQVVAGIRVSDIEGDDAPIKQDNGTFFHPPSLISKIEIFSIDNLKAKKSMQILVSVVRSLAHYMNRVAKETTTGGVLYMPLKVKKNGKIFEIGDAISFQNDQIVDENLLKKFLKTITIVDNPKTDLDLYKKIYYVWKSTYYFGGAGTDPSGTSGNTMRIYLTDSGIHWQSSYEESDITTKIAESMQLHRLSVGT